MKRIFERIKDGQSCGRDDSPRPFIQYLDEIITAELSWGARVSTKDNSYFFETKVFGDIDKTEFVCTPEEFTLLGGIVDTYREGGRNGCNRYLLSVMGIDGGKCNYKTDDVLTIFELHLAGSEASELITLLTPIIPKKSASQPMSMSPELENLAKCLDPDDSILQMINGFRAVRILDEVHHSF